MRPSALIAAAAAAFAALTPSAPAQASERPQVLVLGTFHMANPGHDINSVHVDDVLLPARQAQIAELMTVLERFKPTKIAVEADVGSASLASRYQDYLAGKHELTRNEIEQIGFRLAKMLRQQTIYGVDADGDFPWMPLSDYAKAHGVPLFDSVSAEFAAATKGTDSYLSSHTLLETLLRVNSDSAVALGVSTYARIAQIGEPWNYAGPDLVADWFKRNIRIYNNVVRLASSSHERVLVIFGYGHLGFLRQDFAADPTITLRTLAEFAK
jgi:hypothetical protein